LFALAPEALEVTPKDHHHHKTYVNENACLSTEMDCKSVGINLTYTKTLVWKKAHSICFDSQHKKNKTQKYKGYPVRH